MSNIEIYGVLVILVFSILSISLLEPSLFLYGLWGIRRPWFKGVLAIPLLGYLIIGSFSEIRNGNFSPYYISQFVLPVVYFHRYSKKSLLYLDEKIIILWRNMAILIILIGSYRIITRGVLNKLLWGASFAAAELLLISLFSVLTIMIKELMQSEKLKLEYFNFLVFLLLFVILLFSQRRSLFLGFLFYALLMILILHHFKTNPNLNIMKIILIIAVIIKSFVIINTNKRFRYVRNLFRPRSNLVHSEKHFDANKFSSGRVRNLKRAVEIIKGDIENHDYISLLIGHGIDARCESIVFISEIVEKGTIGLFFYLWLLFSFFKFTFCLTNRIISKSQNDYYLKGKLLIILTLTFPLGIHLIKSIFTFPWSALFPMELIIFSISEQTLISLNIIDQ